MLHQLPNDQVILGLGSSLVYNASFQLAARKFECEFAPERNGEGDMKPKHRNRLE